MDSKNHIEPSPVLARRGTGILPVRSAVRRRTAGSRNSTEADAGRPGFTLPELLVTVAILASSLALLASAVTASQGHGQAAQCAANMREVYLAVHQWMQDEGAERPMPFINGVGDFMFLETGAVVTNLMGRGEPLEDPYLDDPSVFFCPQSGMTAEEYFGLVFAPPLLHGTYIWLYSRFGDFPTSPRGQHNYARDPGYERALMVDSGPLPYAGYDLGLGKPTGEHYNLLHYSGGVEMYFAADMLGMATKLGLEETGIIQDYLTQFVYGP